VAPADDFFNMEIGSPPAQQGSRKSDSIANFANWSPSQLPQAHGPLAAAPWTKGDRVLAMWEPEWQYPGTVGDVKGQSLFIFYDDGSRDWVPVAAVRPLDVQPGSRVFCRFRAGPLFYPATVQTRNGDQLLLRYDHGGIEWSVVAYIRVSSGTTVPGAVAAHQAGSSPERGDFHDRGLQVNDHGPAWTGSQPWTIGERVLAPTGDGWLYPAVVAETRGFQTLVWFDSGSKTWMDADELRHLDITVGSRVYCRWMGGTIYYGGRVKEQHGEQIFIHYDDGDKEWNTIGLVRIPANTRAAFFGNVQSFAQGRYGCLLWIALIVIIFVFIKIFSK
jgi:hypothetical protein